MEVIVKTEKTANRWSGRCKPILIDLDLGGVGLQRFAAGSQVSDQRFTWFAAVRSLAGFSVRRFAAAL